jgi:SAM-dependent methyltransferase
MGDEGNEAAADRFGGREPTSHERRFDQPWDASYSDGPAPWDLGRPQPAIARLAASGAFAGKVLDAGCGSGENALLVASSGLPVLGVDVADTALEMARRAAAARSIVAEFMVADALHLDRLGRTFDSVMDCGLFHTFDGDERRDYVASLSSVTEPGATLHVLCFGDSEPGPGVGPHPVSRDELETAFQGGGWDLVSIIPERIETRFAADGVPAWLATAERVRA